MPVNSHMGANSLTVEFVDLEKALEDFQGLRRDRDAALWAMGEIAERLIRAMGVSEGLRREFARQGLSLGRFGREVGLTPARLRALALTAGTFKGKERHPQLSWEHHHVVASRLADESQAARRKWLKDAHKHQWTARQLKQRLAGARPSPRGTTAEERVEKLRRRLAEAEAELSYRRRDRTRGEDR